MKILTRWLTLLALGALVAACGSTSTSHGQISALSSASERPDDLCEHDVPKDVCARCEPGLVADFKAVGDWCGPHDVPESQCHACHPNLSFEPLPPMPDGADVRELSRAEVSSSLDAHAVDGKITVIDFYAVWCVPCRDVDAHLRRTLASRPNLAVRRILVHDWDDPLAVQFLSGAPTLPYLVVFDAAGREIGDLHGADLDALDALLEEATH